MLIKLNDVPYNSCGIYKINYPNNKIYIGQSVNIKARIQEHNIPSRRKQKCDIAIKEFGVIDEFEILELCDKSKLNEREIYWIEYYNSTNENIGYNVSLGGKYGCSGEYSPKSVFTKEEVYNIRKRRFEGERKKDVYKDFSNHSFMSFEHIWLFRGYSDVGTEFYIEPNSKTRQEYSSIANIGENNNKAKLTEKDVLDIRKLYKDGKDLSNIHQIYNFVSKKTIRRVCNRETWKHI